MRTLQVAVAKAQLRIIQNIRGVCGESEALIPMQHHSPSNGRLKAGAPLRAIVK